MRSCGGYLLTQIFWVLGYKYVFESWRRYKNNYEHVASASSATQFLDTNESDKNNFPKIF